MFLQIHRLTLQVEAAWVKRAHLQMWKTEAVSSREESAGAALVLEPDISPGQKQKTNPNPNEH